MKQASLRVRLLRTLMLPLAGGLLIIAAASYISAYLEADRFYDAQLVHFGKIILLLTQREIQEGDLEQKMISTDHSILSQPYEDKFAYRIWLGNKLMLHSENSKDFPGKFVETGFVDKTIDGQKWRIFVYQHDALTVEVAEMSSVRQNLIDRILGGVMLPQVLVIPVLAIAVWWGVLIGIRPIDELSRLIRQRDPDNLQPIDPPSVPSDLKPVATAFNDLVACVSEVIEREKQFANYAAHEIRTPLAASKALVQVALRTQDADKQRAMFSEAVHSIDRMSHLAEQLLSFVRVQRVGTPLGEINLSNICLEVTRGSAPAAIGKGIDMSSDIAPGLKVRGSDEMLSLLVRNLLDNAIKFTPQGGHVELSLLPVDGKVLLVVSDDGIGIDPSLRERIFDSFYRISGTNEDGCGLGLSIVKWAAEIHQAIIRLGEGIDGRGISFAVAFASVRRPVTAGGRRAPASRSTAPSVRETSGPR